MTILAIGQIAETVGASRDAVAYALRQVKAQPVGRAGLVRLFDERTAEAVQAFLTAKHQRQAERRTRRQSAATST